MEMKNMKKIFSLLAILGLSFSAFAQLDRSVMPLAGAERTLVIGKAETFELKNGLKVIVVNNSKLPRVTYSLILDRKPINSGDKAGLTDILGSILTEGTLTKSKDQIDESVDFMGASIRASANSAFASGLSKYKEDLIAILSDVVLHPAFPEASFEKLVKQNESNLQSAKEDPNSISSNLVSAVTFGKNHPYGQFMTESSLKNIALQDVKDLYAVHFSPQNTYLAIVGDITAKEAKKLVKKYFGAWAPRTLNEVVPSMPTNPTQNTVHLVNRASSVQSVIEISKVVDLKPESADHMAIRVMNQILGGGSSARLFRNLRETKAYTYGAYANTGADLYAGRFSATAEVRNEVTDSAVIELLKEIGRMSDELVSDEELSMAKESIKGSFGRSLEQPSTISNFALNTYRYGLPADYYQNYLIKLSSITKEDVQRVARKYIGKEGFRIAVVGKSSEVRKGLESFGTLSFHDHEGAETSPPVELPEGVTAQSILTSYLNALGGLQQLRSIKTLEMKREATIMGMSIKSQEIYEFPSNAYQLQDIGPMGIIELIKKGDDVRMLQGGQEAPMSDDDKEDLKNQLVWLPELYYDSKGVSYKATGITEVNGKKAYTLEIKVNEETQVDFFDAETGLKLRTQQMVQGQDGKMTSQNTDFLNYEAREGILFPSVIKVPLGPMSAEFTLKEVKLNQKIDNAVFTK